MIGSYTMWFAKCEACRWRGPTRYGDYEAQLDQDEHEELRHGTN